MENSFGAPTSSLSQRSILPLPDNHRSTFSLYSLQSLASGIPTNINEQQTLVSIPVSLVDRGKASSSTKNAAASMAAMVEPLTAHDGGDSHFTNDDATQQPASKCNNPFNLNFKETGSGFAKSTPSTPSEHSSGSDALPSAVGEAKPALASMPVSVPTSASAPDIFDGSVVEREVGTRERGSVKGIAQQKSEKIPLFLQRLFNRNKSKKDK
ncbi:3cf91024-6739-4a26-a4a4-ddca39a34ae4 [Sclerotinia trifoliorum]|uniref:3cf91024-6739-4a26-a4a4-ddca39a34ae4 n=1 Tax=Sclerotinia trifoliorum TaxID=28548 RepID=A0A8H2VPX3_9HELO|nr:3cf91024-6739-4a26-a4a4-ddca39a34ae4 [Sclerotinia trifoliorum]